MNPQFERQVHSATAQFGYDQVRREISARGSVLHGKGPGDRECIPMVVRFGSDAA